jgi:hypothetical protein
MSETGRTARSKAAKSRLPKNARLPGLAALLHDRKPFIDNSLFHSFEQGCQLAQERFSWISHQILIFAAGHPTGRPAV